MVILDDVKLPFSFAPVNPILGLCKEKKQPNTTQENPPQPKETQNPHKKRQLWNLPMNQVYFKTKVGNIDDTWYE